MFWIPAYGIHFLRQIRTWHPLKFWSKSPFYIFSFSWTSLSNIFFLFEYKETIASPAVKSDTKHQLASSFFLYIFHRQVKLLRTSNSNIFPPALFSLLLFHDTRHFPPATKSQLAFLSSISNNIAIYCVTTHSSFLPCWNQNHIRAGLFSCAVRFRWFDLSAWFVIAVPKLDVCICCKDLLRGMCLEVDSVRN